MAMVIYPRQYEYVHKKDSLSTHKVGFMDLRNENRQHGGAPNYVIRLPAKI